VNAGLTWGVRKKFYEQAANQLSNGREITAVVVDFRERMKRRGRTKVAEAVNQVHKRLYDGQSLMAALGDSLPHLERGVIASGERTNKVPDSMRLILNVRERISRLRWKIVASFGAPVVYGLSLYGVMFTIGIYIVPQLIQMVPLKNWTGWGYALYLMGEMAVGWFAPVFGTLLIGGIIAAVRSLPRWTGQEKIPGRVFCDRYMPLYGSYRELEGFAWLLSFATLVEAGVPDVDALQEQIRNSAPWLASRLKPIHTGLRNGLKLDAAMRQSGFNFPSADLIDEIGAYVGYQNFASKIRVVAEQYADALERRLNIQTYVLGGAFSALMFFAFIVVQLGSNSISQSISTSFGF
jgi:type II secretory pathway component PulF